MAISKNKIKSYWKMYGTFGLIKKSLPFLFSYVPLNFYCISGSPINNILPKCPLEIRKGTIADFPLITDFLKNDDPQLTANQIKYLFDMGGELFLAFNDNKLVHVARLRHYPGVLKVHPFERDPLIKIQMNEVYIGHCETSPKFKGLNIYPAVLQYIVYYSFAHGKRTCFISSAPWGKTSIRGIEKAGFSFASQKRKVRIFGKIFNNLWSSSEMTKGSYLNFHRVM